MQKGKKRALLLVDFINLFDFPHSEKLASRAVPAAVVRECKAKGGASATIAKILQGVGAVGLRGGRYAGA
jgi:hypothetical protein